jgi:hypothetical protein
MHIWYAYHKPRWRRTFRILESFSLLRPSFFFFPTYQDGLDCAAHSGKGRGYEAPDSMRDRNQMARELSLIWFVSRSTVTQYWFGFYLVGCFVSRCTHTPQVLGWFYLVGCSPLKMTAGADQREWAELAGTHAPPHVSKRRPEKDSAMAFLFGVSYFSNFQRERPRWAQLM